MMIICVLMFSIFRFIMRPAVRYMTNDLNESSSLWCGSCELNIILWGEAFHNHVAEKHPQLIDRRRGKRLCAPRHYVKTGHFTVNYDSYHACYECGEVVILAEYYMKKHFKSPRHIQGNL